MKIRFVEDYDADGGQPGDAQWLPSGGTGISDSHGNPVPVKERAALAFRCPGCGRPSAIMVDREKKNDTHQWEWDGNTDAPTLKPSINCVGCCGWHGFLTAGEFKSA